MDHSPATKALPTSLAAHLTKTQFLDKIGRLPFGTLLVFGIKSGWAALFGGLMLAALIVTQYVDLPLLARYDWLFLAAIAIQAFMLLTKLERPHEIITIVSFHLVGLGMELFKTSSSIGSWSYPGDAFFHVGNVPLFSGFMYAAVGSYIARSWRVFELQFSNYPHRLATAVLATLIYINFFTHHFLYDIRYVLFAATIFLYGRTWVSYKVNKRLHHMPLIVAFILIAFFIWVAENIGTYTHAWLYPQQFDGWELVSLTKMGSWLLLMIISFIMVDLLHFFRAKRGQRLP
jgi:uncharacterized membrane protein YoaT (DUF817 family)